MFLRKSKKREQKSVVRRCPRCRYVLERPHVSICPRCLEKLPEATGCSNCGQCGPD